MEITCSNFNEALPEIEKCIEDSLFVSIDCEFSGLNTVRNINAFDTPEEYYKKMRTNSKDFLIMQYGLSTFKYNEEENNFKQNSYNFYVFRRPVNRNLPDNRFLCQASSIDFLVKHSFDFNKLFKEGLSYLNEQDADKYKEHIDQAYNKVVESIENKTEVKSDSVQVPENAQSFLDDVKVQINNFLNGDDTEMPLPKCNAFFRRLVYQLGESEYRDKISLETRQVEGDRVLFVSRLKTLEEEKQIAKKKYEEQLKELDNFIGFTKVLKCLIKFEKLIVGHNICLDFFHTIDKFLIPSPDSYSEFKDISHSLFPKVLDTKYMSSCEPFKNLISSTILAQLLENLRKKPFELPQIVIEDPSKGYTVEDIKEHEAGYDAFITGLCFLGMWKHLGLLDNKSDTKTFQSMNLLEPYLNRIYLSGLTDNQCILLSGEDSQPSRDHVFHLTFPKEWKLSNIQQLFSPFGNVFVSWLDDSSAYVGLYKTEQAKAAYVSLRNGDGYALKTFASHRAQTATNQLQKKRKNSDPSTPCQRKKMDASVKSTSIDPARNKLFQESNSWT
ncbi:unnamed protein product [Phyllotreta striolata]|uniref:Poly(A)-specific ribonuclease RNA-binding domain-containing protein n=1 Tax=Phyllotreta striolata TaxID=444603 RepID=A0A9N9TY93_PHYSR|nr:unnamed protein product [Phyllotreta striolata]